MRQEVLVVIGVGGMGQAIARRQGSGRVVLLADLDAGTLEAAAGTLREEGHCVAAHHLDVAWRQSVADLARTAAGLGPVAQVVHTAGLSPAQASAAAILRVDLAGAAYVLEEFGQVVADGGAGVVISSMAGYLATPLDAEQESALARTPADQLLLLPFASPEVVTDPADAYGLAKRVNQLRVQSASVSWGRRGARINSISPGIVATPMGHQELDSASGGFMRAMTDASAAQRLGTPDDIASAAAFLLGPDSSFITGSDLLVDGGVVAAVRSGRLTAPD
ncbi:MAG TPA: SDR family oxidoreductase [Acidimicrobiales bacterium]|nr:SDR family oxidoreductase [Acidimicrobiales bacterium]